MPHHNTVTPHYNLQLRRCNAPTPTQSLPHYNLLDVVMPRHDAATPHYNLHYDIVMPSVFPGLASGRQPGQARPK